MRDYELVLLRSWRRVAPHSTRYFVLCTLGALTLS